MSEERDDGQKGDCMICGGDHRDGHPFRRYTCDNPDCDNEVWVPEEDRPRQLWCASCSPDTGYRMSAELVQSVVRL